MKPVSDRPRPIPLRDAQRALTRSRIREAGREAFFTRGYAQATMDEIAAAAGASRSTLYSHFRDKDVILAEIVQNYTPLLCAVAERLPGPAPSRKQIDAWLLELAAFIARERTPTVLIVGLATEDDAPQCIHELGDRLMAALAVRLPAFRHVLQEGPRQSLAWAWASVVIREAGWACQQFARDPGKGRHLLTVAGDLFERFIREQG